MMNEVLNEVLERYQTPLYVFDARELAHAVDHIAAFLPDGASLCYAMKANPFVAGVVAGRVDRVEVCSAGEARICQALGVPLAKTVVSGVHKDAGLVLELLGSGAYVCRYTVESRLQYELLDRLTSQLGVRVPILMRLTSGNQFGLDVDELRALAGEARESRYLCVCGIQYFAGTQRTSEKRLRREVRYLDDLLVDLRRDLGTEALELEYGPGLPVMYYEGDALEARRIEEAQLAALGDALGSMRFGGKAIVELGRSLVASCGAYVTSVVDVKRNGGYNYAIVDGGRHQISYFGGGMSLMNPPCRVVRQGRGQTGAPDAWTICGSLCTAHDVLAKQMPCEGIEVGDVVVFEKAGAYCMTESMSLFLSQRLPRIVMVDGAGELVQVRNTTEVYPLNGGGIADGNHERHDRGNLG